MASNDVTRKAMSMRARRSLPQPGASPAVLGDFAQKWLPALFDIGDLLGSFYSNVPRKMTTAIPK